MEKIKQTVYKYKTADGMAFDTEEEAKKHENELKSFNVAIQLPNGKKLDKDDIKEFFRQSKCENCPFMVECHNMIDEVRKHTTSAFTLCDVIVFSE